MPPLVKQEAREAIGQELSFGSKKETPFSKKRRPIHPVVLNRWQSFWAMSRIRWHLFQLVLSHTPNLLNAIQAMRTLIKTRRKFLGDSALSKVAKVGDRFYYEYNTPGWPSQAYDAYHLSELNRIAPFQEKPFYLKNVIVAITKKCSLRCEHCFEWDALNGKETLTIESLQKTVQQFQELGVGQLQFSGGEPLLRMPALLALLRTAQPTTDFWILTSGHLLTLANAQSLKEAGLTGVTISLDHVDPELHNQFRGFPSAFDWVVEAAYNANQAGLVVAFSLCATNRFISKDNLMHYTQLARQLGGAFIQVLEPRAVGHYAGKEVAISKEQQTLLEEFYTNLNYNPAFQHLPLVVYYDFQRRRAGCAAAADRHVYVDTDGQLHACPFCQKSAENSQTGDLKSCVASLRLGGCPMASSSK